VPDIEANPQELTESMMRVAAELRDAGIPYALAGSFAAWARGGPAHHTDLDFVLLPEDVERAVELLVDAGLERVPAPEEWLEKVRDGGVVVDLIFQPAGVDMSQDVIDRGDDIEVSGMTFRVMAIDDVMTTKLFAFKEHYLDYEAALEMARTLREQIDWDELRRRCAGYPYAQPFFTLVEELGVIERPGGDHVGAAHVRAAQQSRHG
jgi:Nucleotidyl transferase of unknown function (DUF2204)